MTVLQSLYSVSYNPSIPNLWHVLNQYSILNFLKLSFFFFYSLDLLHVGTLTVLLLISAECLCY